MSKHVQQKSNQEEETAVWPRRVWPGVTSSTSVMWHASHNAAVWLVGVETSVQSKVNIFSGGKAWMEALRKRQEAITVILWLSKQLDLSVAGDHPNGIISE